MAKREGNAQEGLTSPRPQGTHLKGMRRVQIRGGQKKARSRAQIGVVLSISPHHFCVSRDCGERGRVRVSLHTAPNPRERISTQTVESGGRVRVSLHTDCGE